MTAILNLVAAKVVEDLKKIRLNFSYITNHDIKDTLKNTTLLLNIKA
jgi:hypothetical protein